MKTARWYFDYISPYAYLQSAVLSRFERYARIDGPDGEMCAQSRTDWVLIDIAAKRPARVLPWMVERFTPKA